MPDLYGDAWMDARLPFFFFEKPGYRTSFEALGCRASFEALQNFLVSKRFDGYQAGSMGTKQASKRLEEYRTFFRGLPYTKHAFHWDPTSFAAHADGKFPRVPSFSRSTLFSARQRSPSSLHSPFHPHFYPPFHPFPLSPCHLKIK